MHARAFGSGGVHPRFDQAARWFTHGGSAPRSPGAINAIWILAGTLKSGWMWSRADADLVDEFGEPGILWRGSNELVCGKRGVTPETALLLAGAFGTTPEFWLSLQTNHDLVRTRPARKVRQLAGTAPAHS